QPAPRPARRAGRGRGARRHLLSRMERPRASSLALRFPPPAVRPLSGWPALSAARDRPTIVALHLFSQVIGKVPTAVLPWRNHGWHLTLHLRPRGLSTEPIYA